MSALIIASYAFLIAVVFGPAKWWDVWSRSISRRSGREKISWIVFSIIIIIIGVAPSGVHVGKWSCPRKMYIDGVFEWKEESGDPALWINWVCSGSQWHIPALLYVFGPKSVGSDRCAVVGRGNGGVVVEWYLVGQAKQREDHTEGMFAGARITEVAEVKDLVANLVDVAAKVVQIEIPAAVALDMANTLNGVMSDSYQWWVWDDGAVIQGTRWRKGGKQITCYSAPGDIGFNIVEFVSHAGTDEHSYAGLGCMVSLAVARLLLRLRAIGVRSSGA